MEPGPFEALRGERDSPLAGSAALIGEPQGIQAQDGFPIGFRAFAEHGALFNLIEIAAPAEGKQIDRRTGAEVDFEVHFRVSQRLGIAAAMLKDADRGKPARA